MRPEKATEGAETLELPAWRYLPGRNERHAEDAFDRIKMLCPCETTEKTARSNIAWRYGLRLFNEGFYWEAHEILELVWQRARPNSRERFVVQCVIHLANGALKSALGQAKARGRLAAMAEECRQRAFAGAVGSVMGLSDSQVAKSCRFLASADPPSRLGHWK